MHIIFPSLPLAQNGTALLYHGDPDPSVSDRTINVLSGCGSIIPVRLS